LCAALLAPAIAFVVLHIVTPSDGAHMDPTVDSWRRDGIVLTPLEPGTSPLRAGDVLVAVEGQSLETWAEQLFRLDRPRPQWEFGQTVMYTVRRGGAVVDVPVLMGRLPLGQIIANQTGNFLAALLFLAVMTFLYFKVPQEPVTRVFLLGSAAQSSSFAWALGLQTYDFVGAMGFWLHQISSLAVYVLIWVAALHVFLIFPQPQSFLSRRPWIVAAAYVVPFGLYALYVPLAAALSSSTLEALGRINAFPIWVALGCLTLTGVLGVRGYRALRSPTHRLQVRWLLFSAVLFCVAALGLGVIPELLWGEPILGWDVISLIALVVPAGLVIAVLRYRLFDIDIIINRTLVYVPLTAILAGAYAASIKLFQVFFVAATGNESDGAIILTTLILASAFTPVKNGIQTRVDRTFSQPLEPARRLRAFDQQVQQLIEALDTRQAIRRLLDLAVDAYGARGGAVYLSRNGRQSVVYRTPGWKGEGARRVPLEWEGSRVGMLKLGPPRPGWAQPPLDPSVLEGCAERVAHLSQLLQARSRRSH
jgi:hypothetical protein